MDRKTVCKRLSESANVAISDLRETLITNTSDIGMQQDDEDKGSESIHSDEDDISDDQFDENIDEPHPLDKRDNEGKLQVSEEVKKDFGEIIRRRAGDMKRAMRPFRLWSSQSDEEQIESESEGREQNSVNE